jgi:hypothetical protein
MLISAYFTAFVDVVGSDRATTCQIVALQHKGIEKLN